VQDNVTKFMRANTKQTGRAARFIAAVGLVCAAQPQARAGFGMDDIAYWVGAGTNRAALVVDWNDGIDPVSLAWGFRWNGAATGQDMFEAAAAADARLFLLVRNLGAGQTVYGAGYDADSRTVRLLDTPGPDRPVWVDYVYDAPAEPGEHNIRLHLYRES